MVGTACSFLKVGLRPLTSSQGLTLIKNQWTTKYPKFLDGPTFQKLIELCGNIPRIWELVHARIKDLTELSTKQAMEILHLLCQDVQTRYSLEAVWCNLKFHCALLAMMQRWALQETPWQIKSSLLSLHYVGVIFAVDDRCFIPPIFLYGYAMSVNNSRQELCKKLFVHTIHKAILGHGVDFEEFVLSFYCLKFNLLHVFEIKKCSVQQFFLGASMSQILAIHRIPIGGNYMSFENGNGNNIAHLRTNGPFTSTIDCVDTISSFSIHLDKNHTGCDGIITIQGEYCFGFKYAQTQTGNDENGIMKGKLQFFESNLKLEKNIFIYISNSNDTTHESTLSEAISDNSLFIQARNWSETFATFVSGCN